MSLTPSGGLPRPRVITTSTTETKVDFRHEQPCGGTIWLWARNTHATAAARLFFSAEEAADGSSTRYITLPPSVADTTPPVLSIPCELPDGCCWVKAVSGTPVVELLVLVKP